MPSGIYKTCKSGWGAAGCIGTAGLIGLRTLFLMIKDVKFLAWISLCVVYESNVFN